ncbi:unnamed protein product [Durusdinium trenchii]
MQFLTFEDFIRCVPGVFIIMLTDLVGHIGHVNDLSQVPSFHYVNHAFPYAIQATTELMKAGWNLIPLWKSVKAVAQMAHYGNLGRLHRAITPCDAQTERAAVQLMSGLQRGIVEQDVQQLRRAAASVPASWRLSQWSQNCSCCMVPAALAIAGMRNLVVNKERFLSALHFMHLAAKGNWVDLLLWNPWPVLEILEAFLPWPQRVIQLVTVQGYEEEESCFKQGPRSSSRHVSIPTGSKHCETGRDVVAVLLRGRSFVWRRGVHWRSGGLLGLPESVVEQLVAAESHMAQLVRPLEDLGFQVEIYGATYETPYLEELQAAYRPSLVKNFTLLRPPGSQLEGLSAALALLPDDPCIQHVVLLRFDLILKRPLVPFIQRAWRAQQDFIVPFWCEVSKISQIGGELCVSDVLQMFPARYAGYVQKALQDFSSAGISHFHKWVLQMTQLGVLPSQVGVLVRRRFVTDPAGQWNPLYDFANRERRPPSLELRHQNWTI